MSIVPVGKNRHQVNQGGFKHESMLDTDAFEKIFKQALAPGTVIDQVDQDVEVPDDLQSTMNQGGLNPEIGMPEGADKGGTSNPNKTQHMQFGEPGSQTSDNPEGWKFDPQTGEPLSGLKGTDVYNEAYQTFGSQNLRVEPKGDLHANDWQVIISPLKGRMVSK